jgi:hypothetical protein
MEGSGRPGERNAGRGWRARAAAVEQAAGTAAVEQAARSAAVEQAAPTGRTAAAERTAGTSAAELELVAVAAIVCPASYLTSWRKGGQKSPASAVKAWNRKHGCKA